MEHARRLVLVTDGAKVQVLECAWTPLELRAAFQGLLGTLDNDSFPLPQGMPQLVVPEKPKGEET